MHSRVVKRFTHLAAATMAAVIVLTSGTPRAADGVNAFMGINLHSARDWAGNFFFADAMKSARKWSEIGGDGNLRVDEHGWPLEDASITVMHGLSQSHGWYDIYFTGQATVNNTVDMTYDAATNTSHCRYQVTDPNGAYVNLSFRNTNGGVQNVKMMRPTVPGGSESYDTTVTFTDQIKAAAMKFDFVRYMDLLGANTGVIDSVLQSTLAGKIDKDDFTQCPWETDDGDRWGYQGPGIAYEYVVQFANETMTHPYINIYVSTEDAKIRWIAELFRDNLDPSLNLYVEYSNEVWNATFPQNGWNLRAASSPTEQPTLRWDGSDMNGWQLGYRRMARRTTEISTIFREVFGDAAMMTRVRPLLMWQRANANNYAHIALTFMQEFYNVIHALNSEAHPPGYYIYGGGGVGYYGPDRSASLSSVTDVLNSGSMNLDNPDWTDEQAFNAKLTASYGLRHVVYEGGLATEPGSNFTEALKNQLRDDPRVTANIVGHINRFHSVGGHQFCYFQVNDANETWGLSETVMDLTTPAWKAIDSLATLQRTPVSVGVAAGPGQTASMAGGSWFATNTNYGRSGSINGDPTAGAVSVPQGRYFTFPFYVTQDGSYQVTVHYTSGGSATIGYGFGGEAQNVQSVSATSSATATDPVARNLYADRMNAAFVKSEQGSFSIDHVEVAYVGALGARSCGQGSVARAHATFAVARTANTLHVSARVPTSGEYLIVMHDLGGRVRTIRPVSMTAGVGRSVAIQVSGLCRGTYVVSMHARDGALVGAARVLHNR
ncbi:MAG: hypothetical protein GF331_16765 [Chitinivibrionales bacterium]|nr:hypothetical protein [Chitinivibrionales bacterium]